MASKTKIRSFRFSEEIEEIINQQVGETFSAKLERLIYNCYMLAPEKEKEIVRLNSQILHMKHTIRLLSDFYDELSSSSKFVSSQLSDIRNHLDNLRCLAEVDFDKLYDLSY